jgi:hypothetical protein
VASAPAGVALRQPGGRIIAKRIIELAKAGERNPDLLCEGVLKEFRERQLLRRDTPPLLKP